LIFSSSPKPDTLKPETDFTFEHAKKRLGLSLGNYLHHLPGEVYIFLDFPQARKEGGNGEYKSLFWIAKRLGETKVELEKGPSGELTRT
jgi:hypothetical protein